MGALVSPQPRGRRGLDASVQTSDLASFRCRLQELVDGAELFGPQIPPGLFTAED